MRAANPGEIDAIHAHLRAGHEIAIATYAKCTVLGIKHVDYIRADGQGYRCGWPGKGSTYTFANSILFVPAGQTLKATRRGLLVLRPRRPRAALEG
jgi:hypothetical protein